MPWTREDVDQTMMVLSHTITAESDGTATVANGAGAVTDHEVFGMLVQMRIVEGGTAPTDLWDLTIVDDTGTGVILALGDNITNASDPNLFTQSTDFDNGIAIDGDLTITAAAMGNGGIATVTLYIIRMGL